MQKQWQLLCILRNFFESQMEFVKPCGKKPYRQYDVLIAKVLSIDICKKKNHLCDHYLSPLSSNYCVILPV